MISEADIHYMRSAIALARRGLGRTAPNPSVGCVIVKDGLVLARTRTADSGRPHAERLALDVAGGGALGSTLYVTLEPCTHYGQTPPCTDAIIEAGVCKVVIGSVDCNPQVNGASFEILEKAGIEVVCGVLEDECREVNRGFFNTILKNRPYVTLKAACSLDGNIALGNGQSQWITGDEARRHAHLLRSSHDAIMVGIGTVLKDDPMLSVRICGVNHNILRVVMDTNLDTPLDSVLVKSAYAKRLCIIHGAGHGKDEAAFIAAGVQLHQIDDSYDLDQVLEFLAKQGITRLLVEGGSRLYASFLNSGLFDELALYRAPTILGSNAVRFSGDFSIDALDKRLDLKYCNSLELGSDVLEIYKNYEYGAY